MIRTHRTVVVRALFYLLIYKMNCRREVLCRDQLRSIHGSQLIFNRYGKGQATVSSRLQYQARNSNSNCVFFYRKSRVIVPPYMRVIQELVTMDPYLRKYYTNQNYTIYFANCGCGCCLFMFEI